MRPLCILEEDPLARILSVCDNVQKRAGIFNRVRQNMLHRCNAGSEVGGCHFRRIKLMEITQLHKNTNNV